MGYASLTDLYTYGAPATAFGTLTDPVKQAALDEASNRVDEYIGARYALPLISWPTSITEYTCRIATYTLLVARGFNPQAGSDDAITSRYNDALAKLTLIQKQQLHPAVVPQPAQTPTYVQPTVLSSSVVSVGTGQVDSNRGW